MLNARDLLGQLMQAGMTSSTSDRVGHALGSGGLAQPGNPIGDLLRSLQGGGQAHGFSGLAEAAHIHLARKYNGEWINADGAIPFDLGGWVATEGDQEYDGVLTRGNQTRESCECKLPSVNGVAL